MPIARIMRIMEKLNHNIPPGGVIMGGNYETHLLFPLNPPSDIRKPLARDLPLLFPIFRLSSQKRSAEGKVRGKI
jgi:hypothetical protein